MKNFNLDDNFLIKQILSGNDNAFRLLILRYERPLFGYLRRFACKQEEIEDIAQETFLKAYRNLKSFDPHKGASFTTWLFTIAKNQSIDSLRKSQGSIQIDVKNVELHYSETAETSYIKREEISQLHAAMNSIPTEFRSAVAMSCIQELTLEEIAKIENVAIGTIKSRIFRGKQMLAKILCNTNEGLANET